MTLGCSRGRVLRWTARRFAQIFSSGSRYSPPMRALMYLSQRVRAVRNDQEGIATFVPNAHKVFVDELLDQLEKHYKLNDGRGLPQFKSHVKPIRAAFGDMRAVNVTAKVVDDYIDDRLEGDKKAGIRPKAPATV